MVIIYHLTAQGFTAGDIDTGRTVFAYATSTHARAAVRHPERTAREMLAQPQTYPYPECIREAADAMDRKRMFAMWSSPEAVRVYSDPQEVLPDLPSPVTAFRIQAIADHQAALLRASPTMTAAEYERATHALACWTDRPTARVPV